MADNAPVTEAATSLSAGHQKPVAAAALASQFIIVAALVAEVILVVGGVRGWSFWQLLAAHCAVVAIMTVLLRRRISSGSDGGVALLAAVGTLATGPFGAAGALLMPALTRGNNTSTALLTAWYDRIALSGEQDDFTKLSDRVAIGRAADLAAPAPRPFVELFKSGPIAEQQVALGMIARGFHSGYLPVLKLALDSPEPVIRVQAAAVAARVRGQLNSHAETLFARAADPTLSPSDAMDVAAELRAAIDSGLLEASEHTTAKGVLDGLSARLFARLDARRRRVEQGGLVPSERLNDDVHDAYATQLLQQGRFADFRAYRVSLRRPVLGRYRHRLVRARRISAASVMQLRPAVGRP